MKTILILGASLMQRPAIIATKKMGLRVCLVDANKRALCAKEGDYFLKADLKDVEAVYNAALKFHSRFNLNAIFTAGTDFSYTVAVVASRLGLPCITPENALASSNKGKMRERFAANNINSVKFYLTQNILTTPSSHTLGFPCVVKPVDNMGGRGTCKVGNFEELQNAIATAINFSRTSQAIVEEFVDGEEYSIDSLVYNGEVTIRGFALRHIFFPPYFIEMGHTIPAKIEPSKYEEITSEFKRAVEALGIDNGVAKGDIKFGCTPNDAKPKTYIGEIAARLSGGYMSGWTYPKSSGVDLTTQAIKIAFGEAPQIQLEAKDRYCAERAFISAPGVVTEIIEPKKLNPNFEYSAESLFLRVKKGSKVDFPKNNVEKCGNILYLDSDYEKSCGIANKIASSYLVRLKPNCEVTKKFLLNESKNAQIPKQFSIKDESIHLNLFNYLPKKKSRNSRSSIVAFLDGELLLGQDWHSLSSSDLFELLQSEERLLVCAQKELFDEFDDKSALKVPTKLLATVLSNGSRQGFYWLLDYLDRLGVKKAAKFLQSWSNR